MAEDIEKLATMSDEDFLKYSGEEEDVTSEEEVNQSDDIESDEATAKQEDNNDSVSGTGSKEDDEPSNQSENTQNQENIEQVNPLESPEQYEQFYKTVMAPIKANGKAIQLRSANDVISLIQQGANYTKKMQAIAPYRKHLKLLEDNDLLDESKLRFLIDVAKGDKEAIKKLMYDNKLDSSDLAYDDFNEDDLDEEGNPKPKTYYPKTSMVSDQEVAWSDAWKELLEQEKIDNIDTHSVIMNMDSQSLKQVYENPQILNLMHLTQACGAYDKIVSEMDRLKTLGYINDNAPFLDTFIQVKNIMLQQGMLNDEAQKATMLSSPYASQANNIPMPTNNVSKVKSKVTNNDKARAAAPSRSSGKSTKPFLNPLNMSDEEFLKHYDEI